MMQMRLKPPSLNYLQLAMDGNHRGWAEAKFQNRSLIARGTGSSKPVPSSGESGELLYCAGRISRRALGGPAKCPRGLSRRLVSPWVMQASITGVRRQAHASGYIRSLIELTWPRRICVLCPERDKVRSLPRTPTPHGSPPADAGALRAAQALLPFVAFVRPRRRTRGHYRGRCNLPATMR